jgi:hypothetical protein
MRRLVPLIVMAAVMAASGVARAQSTGDDDGTGSGSGTLPNGAQIEFQHLKVYKASDNDFVETEANSNDRLHGFNRAACNCAKADHGNIPNVDKPQPADAGWFSYLIYETPVSGLHVPVEFFVGNACTDQLQRDSMCKQLTYTGVTTGDLDGTFNVGGGQTTFFNLFDVINGSLHQTEACQELEGNAPIYMMISTTGQTDTFDVQLTQNAGTLSTDSDTTANGIDTRPPPTALNVQANPSDETINVSWTAATASNTDIAYYQVLCADLTGSVIGHRAADARYVTTRSQCPSTYGSLSSLDTATEQIQVITDTTVPGTTADAGVDDGGTVPIDAPPDAATSDAGIPAGEMPLGAPDPNSGFGQLDEAYVCGEATSSTATSLSIHGLTNGKPYQLIFVTIDLHGNYTARYIPHTVTPIPVTDFWEDLHNRGSHAEGGLCLLNETYGDDSGINGALRAFRDDTLAATTPGRWLIRAYYATLGQWGGLVHGSLALRVVAGVLLAPVVALGLLWHALSLPGLMALVAALALLHRLWQRRAELAVVLVRARGALAGAAAAAALIVLVAAPGQARADKAQPYWETDPLDQSTDSNGSPSSDQPNYDPTFDPTLNSLPAEEDSKPSDDDALQLGPVESHWHVGVRVGPYTPDIDKQLGGASPGPYKQMFGGDAILPMVDIDRVLWSDFGQVLVGLSIGYMQKTAESFADGSSPTDNPRMRVKGADNTFRLLPLALTATYRFTWLDDTYGIPLVPYLKGGLAYYAWEVKAPNGSDAVVCKNGGMEPCSENTALGGSLGVVGAIGLAIRAERLEASTATSMRQSGIQHAGIYGELSIANVDGFGSDSKLSVGARTWFAGVDFEF